MAGDGITPEQAAAAIPRVSESFKKLNPGLFPGYQRAPPAPAASVPAKKRLRQSRKPILNKLEIDFLTYLRALHPGVLIHPQAKRYELARGHWYKPDFTATLFIKSAGGHAEYREIAWEVKGPKSFRGGFENLKVAARVWPDVEWRLVWKDAGVWQAQEILT